MTEQHKQLWDAFMSGVHATEDMPDLGGDNARQILRGRFEEWMDGQDRKKQEQGPGQRMPNVGIPSVIRR